MTIDGIKRCDIFGATLVLLDCDRTSWNKVYGFFLVWDMLRNC